MNRVLGTLIVLFVAVSVFITSTIATRQQVLRQVAHHNDAWAVGQTVSEFLRFESTFALYNLPNNEITLNDVRLRLDIFISRLTSLQTGSLVEALAQSEEIRETINILSALIERIDAELEVMSPAEMVQVLTQMRALNGPLIQLSTFSVQHGWSNIDENLVALENLHYLYVVILTLLLVAWCLLVALQIKQNRQLKRTQKEAKALNTQLISKSDELVIKNRSLEYAAHHDALTNLTNRTYFWKEIEQLIQVARTKNKNVHLILLDLNDFKGINDTLGHDSGDVLLSHVGQRMLEFGAQVHIVSRLGGDEFACTLLGASESDVSDLAHSISARVSSPYSIMGREVKIGCCIGISCGKSDECIDAPMLFKQADLALYQAKILTTGNICHFKDHMLEEFDDRKQLERDLRKAVELDEFELFYQAQVDVMTLDLRGLEALCRWNHKSRGVISPLVFIPIAEKSGIIKQLGRIVLNKACEEAVSWKNPLKIAVNISPLQLLEHGFVECVSQAITQTGLAPERLELEITETVMLSDRDRAISVLAELRTMGVTVALDDFGTGYSSLAILRDLPFDTLKLDKLFVRDIVTNKKAEALIKLVAAIGNSLGKTVIIEGIETRAQHEKVQQVGGLISQGFLFARPVNHERLGFLRENDQSLEVVEALAH